MQRISIVGLGRMGGALAIALSHSGFEIADVIVRRPESADLILAEINTPVNLKRPGDPIDGDIVIIATSDPSIAGCSESLSNSLVGRPVVLHTSGSLSSAVLAACASIGCETGSMHPLVSVSDALSGSRNFAGRYFCLEGTPGAVEAAKSIVNSLSGNAFSIDTKFKPLYHAAAVTSAGHVVALFSVAANMLSQCGVSATDAEAILLPLLESTVQNLRSKRSAEALTGSFARLDISAFDRHLSAFEGILPGSIQQIYVMLGEKSIDLVEQADGDPELIAEFRKRINMAKRGLEC